MNIIYHTALAYLSHCCNLSTFRGIGRAKFSEVGPVGSYVLRHLPILALKIDGKVIPHIFEF